MKLHRVIAGLISLFALLLIGVAVHGVQALRNGPQPVGWDREGCAECHMLISDRHFAAQLQTAAGEILNFDDPGCLMTYVASRHIAIHALYFRDSQSSQWLRPDEAGFLRTAQSPMGYALAAVPKSVPGALTYDAVLRQVQRASETRGGK